MSVASMPKRRSISARIASVHGSAPWIPTASPRRAGSTPACSHASAMTSAYEGVHISTCGAKSDSNWTCFSVFPPDIGTTVQPRRSAP